MEAGRMGGRKDKNLPKKEKGGRQRASLWSAVSIEVDPTKRIYRLTEAGLLMEAATKVLGTSTSGADLQPQASQ